MNNDPNTKKQQKQKSSDQTDRDKDQNQTSGIEKLKEDDSALHEETRVVNEQEQDLIINPSDDYLPGGKDQPMDNFQNNLTTGKNGDDDDDDDDGMEEEITPPDEPGIEIPHLDEDDDADDVKKKLPRMMAL